MNPSAEKTGGWVNSRRLSLVFALRRYSLD